MFDVCCGPDTDTRTPAWHGALYDGINHGRTVPTVNVSPGCARTLPCGDLDRS